MVLLRFRRCCKPCFASVLLLPPVPERNRTAPDGRNGCTPLLYTPGTMPITANSLVKRGAYSRMIADPGNAAIPWKGGAVISSTFFQTSSKGLTIIVSSYTGRLPVILRPFPKGKPVDKPTTQTLPPAVTPAPLRASCAPGCLSNIRL
jgi:hypothetical protein